MALKSSESSHDWQVEYSEIKLRAKRLLRLGEWSDCTFHFKTNDAGAGAGDDAKNSLNAHKLILAMASPVFAAMFYGAVGAKDDPVVISDIHRATFNVMIHYIYSDEVFIRSIAMAINLYYAADKYILIHLKKLCLNYLLENLKPSNVCKVYEFSCFYGEDELERSCVKLFSSNTQKVLKKSNLENAQVNTLKKIFSMDSLHIKRETDLYNAVLDYIESKKISDDDKTAAVVSVENKEEDEETKNNNTICEMCCADFGLKSSAKKCADEDLRKGIHGVVEQIRFLTMSVAELAKIYEGHSILTNDEKLALFINLSDPKSNIPMPDGFSTSRELRINEVIEVEFLSLYIYCYGKESTNWSCYAKAEMSLLSTEKDDDNDTKARCRTIQRQFKHGQGWGYENFIRWDVLVDPARNFVKNNSMTLEVHIVTEPVEGDDADDTDD